MGPGSSPAGARYGMKIGRELLIVGAGGMLGTALAQVASQHGWIPRAYTEAELDITDGTALVDAVARFVAGSTRVEASGAVVNAAAYTDVEKAEDEVERAYLVNERAAGRLAAVARDAGLAFLHVSTDFVFDGSKQDAYRETDEPNPLNVYGRSKLAGEQAVLSSHPEATIVRTAWTFGPGGTNFPTKILERAQALTGGGVAGAPGGRAAMTAAEPVGLPAAAPKLQVVSDEVGSPTYSVDLAAGLLALLSTGATGLFHLTGTGFCSRYELALETLRLAGYRIPGGLIVEPVPSGTFSTRAERPFHAVLDCSKAAKLGVALPGWQDGLARFLAGLRDG